VLADGTQYAVTVTASQLIAVVVNTHNDDASVAAPIAYSTNGIVSGASTVYGPYAAKNANDQGFAATVSTIRGTEPWRRFGQPKRSRSRRLAAAHRRRSPGPPRRLAHRGPSTRDSKMASPARLFAARRRAPAVSPTASTPLSSQAPGGAVAAAVNVLSPTTAMGYVALVQAAPKFFLPNVTRTLGGSIGWTTPILLQTVGADRCLG